jgi:small subunit ribosomal protein S3Ae
VINLARKVKGKEWFNIIAPPFFGEKEIGKTLSSNPEALVGKKITLNAIELINDLNKFYLKLTFRIYKVEGSKALTQFNELECLRDYIARMVLRRVTRIDLVQDLMTKDQVKIRFKGLIVTSKKITSNVKVKIRKFANELIQSEVKNSTLEELLEKSISDELKNKIKAKGRKIYPIRNFEVRKIEVSV